MASSCPVCSSNSEFYQLYRSLNKAFNKINISKCDKCDLYFADPMPSDEELKDYNLNYWQNAHGISNNSKGPFKANPFFSMLAAIRLQYILDNHQIGPGRVSILEIGPGSGEFASLVVNQLKNLEYTAIETDVSHHLFLKSIGVNLISQIDLNTEQKAFDIIVVSHVLEHVNNPCNFLCDLSEHINESGIIFIEVPCLDFVFNSIDEPHLLFFDKPSLATLLYKSSLCPLLLSYHGAVTDSNYYSTLMILVRKIIYKMARNWPGLLRCLPNDNRMKFIENEQQRILAYLHMPHVTNCIPSAWIRCIATKAA